MGERAQEDPHEHTASSVHGTGRCPNECYNGRIKRHPRHASLRTRGGALRMNGLVDGDMKCIEQGGGVWASVRMNTPMVRRRIDRRTHGGEIRTWADQIRQRVSQASRRADDGALV